MMYDAAHCLASNVDYMARSDYQHLYKTGHWQGIRRHQLLIEPTCRMCMARGVLTPAAVVDHVERHRGDPNKFFLGAVQSLCKACHDRHKQIEENRGYQIGCDAQGWPLDPRRS
jgi:hypothetical protein